MYCSNCATKLPPDAIICPACNTPSATEIAKLRDSLRDKVFEAYFNEHKDITDTWRNLETKAQGNIAIAGIFIAGVFGFLTRGGTTLTGQDKILLVAAIIGLSISTGFAVYALIVRTKQDAPLGDANDNYWRSMELKTDAVFLADLPKFFNQILGHWRDYRVKAREVYDRKVEALFVAQIVLISSIILVAVLAVIKTIRP